MLNASPRIFWLVIISALGLGFLWPEPGRMLQPWLMYLLMIMMFLSCLRIDLRELKAVPHEWRRYILLLLFIFLIPTAVVFLAQQLFEPTIFVGLALAAASPAAISIVFLSDLYHGQPSKALTTTVLAHLVSPLLTPALVWLVAGQLVRVDVVSIMWLIVKLVVIPLVAAQIVRLMWREVAARVHLPLVNASLLLAIIWGIIAPTREIVLEHFSQFLLVFGVVIIILIFEYLAGTKLGHNRAEDVTWVIADSYKNFTLSAVLALSLFGPAAVIGSVAFTIAGNLLLIPLPWLVRRFPGPQTRPTRT